MTAATDQVDEVMGVDSPDGLYPFVRAMFDAPADDAPRLILADWLDDHARPGGGRLRWWTAAKAELLKAEIARADAATDYAALKSVAEKLRDRHGHLACVLACVAIREYQELHHPIDYDSFATHGDSESIRQQTNAAWLAVELIGCGVRPHSGLEKSVADAAWSSAYAAWSSTYAAWSSADAAGSSADAAGSSADAAWSSTYAAWSSAYAAGSSAEAAGSSAEAAWSSAEAQVRRFALAAFCWRGWKAMPEGV